MNKELAFQLANQITEQSSVQVKVREFTIINRYDEDGECVKNGTYLSYRGTSKNSKYYIEIEHHINNGTGYENFFPKYTKLNGGRTNNLDSTITISDLINQLNTELK
jgi:hypothetical protein